jgi:hypothetical protein
MGDARLGHGVSFVRSDFAGRIGVRLGSRDADRHAFRRVPKFGSIRPRRMQNARCRDAAMRAGWAAGRPIAPGAA